jgi:hypothetical protein
MDAATPMPCSHPVASPVPTSGQVAPLRPRLLDLDGAAAYLGLRPWNVRELVRAGTLARVSVPLGPDRRGRRADGNLRRVLVDVVDLDRLVDTWKAVPLHAGRDGA